MSKPQSVCLVSFDFPPLEGGISRLCAAIVDELVDREESVSVISREVDKSQHAFASTKTEEYRVSRKRGKAEWQLFHRLRKFHRNDVVITGVWYPEALIAKLAGCKHITTLAHGNDVMQGAPSLKNRLLNWLRKKTLSNVELVIANSHYTAELVNSQAKAKIEVATLGVDSERFIPLSQAHRVSARDHFSLPEDAFVILTTSRVQAYKGHDIVLRAIAALPMAIRRKVHYAIAGRGEHLPFLKAKARALEIDSQVTFLGFVEESDLAMLYGCADCFVMCTREEKAAKQVEGFGLVFLEAQASGTLAIGTRQGGIVDAIEQDNGGFLIERDDVDALTKRFEELVTSPDVCNAQNKLARERVEQKATWQHYGQRVASLLDNYFGSRK